MSVVDQTKSEMVAAVDHLKNELKNIRTGRANPAMVENVKIEVYGSEMRLKDIATITSPEPRQLLITPFDPSNAAMIGKGIDKANLGFKATVDAHSVRIQIPPMTKEIREQMIKVCRAKKEETKITIRHIRQKSNDLIKKQKSSGEIPEDMLKKLEKSIQELTDKYCKEVEEASEKKEQEVSSL